MKEKTFQCKFPFDKMRATVELINGLSFSISLKIFIVLICLIDVFLIFSILSPFQLKLLIANHKTLLTKYKIG